MMNEKPYDVLLFSYPSNENITYNDCGHKKFQELKNRHKTASYIISQPRFPVYSLSKQKRRLTITVKRLLRSFYVIDK